MTPERRRNRLRIYLGNQTLMNREINQNNRNTKNNNQENKKLEDPGSTANESAVLSSLISGKIFLWRSGATLLVVIT
jgi:hypothetical protein